MQDEYLYFNNDVKRRYNKFMYKKYKGFILLIIISIVIINYFSFSPAFNNGFVNWDDNKYIIENGMIKHLSLENIKKIITISDFRIFKEYRFVKGYYIPLTLFSFAVEYHFFHLNPLIYHSTNIMLHILNCLLVFWFIYLLCGNLTVSFLTSVFFGIHPLRVESVAWITERKDLLCAFFGIFSIIGYVLYLNGSRYMYALSVMALFLSFISKPSMITIPLICIAIDLFYNRKKTVWGIWDKIPFFLLAVMFALINIYVGRLCIEAGHKIEIGSNDSVINFCIPFYGLLFYIEKMIVPYNLSCFYPYPGDGRVFIPPVIILSPVIVLMLITLIFYISRYSKKITFASWFIILTFLPVMQIFVKFNVVAADRYTYIPSIAFVYMFVELMIGIYKRLEKKSEHLKFIFFWILQFGLIIVLLLVTRNRCCVWGDGIRLWSDVLSKYPEVCIAYNCRGNLYSDRNDLKKAFNDYDNAIKYNPRYAIAYLNRGILFEQTGNVDKAVADFGMAIKLRPDLGEAYLKRAKAFLKKENFDDVIEDSNRALILNHYETDAYLTRGMAFLMEGDYNRSILDFTYFIKLEHNKPDGYLYRGLAYSSLKKYDEALKDYNNALIIDNALFDAYYNRGLLYYITKRYKMAVADFSILLSNKHDNLLGYMYRGMAFQKIGDYGQAIKDLTEAIRLDPSRADLYYLRGEIYSKNGMYALAIKDLSKLAEIEPLNKKIRFEINNLYYKIRGQQKVEENK